jgi:diadenosine tetraphosphate (Ap4A) HIT family hydrolase
MNSQPNCPFCLANNLFKGEVLAESADGFATAARGSEHCYLIIPKEHTEALDDLPDNWWADFKELLGKLPTLRQDYNLSLNMGGMAGQTAKHLHFWIVPRKADTKSAGHGLVSLIGIVDRTEKNIE